MNALVIVDPQIDFISGSLAVPGATEAMDYLIYWMQIHQSAYTYIFVSMDQHPIDHCSFVEQGGGWPAHCVRYSRGAALYPPLMQALQELKMRGKKLRFIEKATEPNRDCYSAFADNVPSELLGAERIYLAGLAGDYCVAASQEDLFRVINPERLVRIEEAIAWIDPPQCNAY